MPTRPAPADRTVRAPSPRASLPAPCRATTSHRAVDAAPDGESRTVRGLPQLARSAAPCGREARCQPAPRLQTAPSAVRHPVRASALRAALQGRTQRSTPHQTANPAPRRRLQRKKRHIRRTGGAVPARPAPPDRTERGPSPRASFRAPCRAESAHPAANAAPDGEIRTVRGLPQLTRNAAPGGREARRQPAPRLQTAPCAVRPPCELPRSVPRYNLAPSGPRRTRWQTPHRARASAHPRPHRARTARARYASSMSSA